MARYEDDFFRDSFRGFPPPRRDAGRGMDPNYGRRGYRGERMEPGDRYHAAYGRYRARHTQELSGYARYDQEMRLRGYDRDFRQERDPGFGREREDGVRYDSEYLRDFNANSTALRYGPARRGPVPRRSFGKPEEVNRGRPTHRTDASRNLRYDDGFARYTGYNSGGFAEPWVRYDPVGRKDAPT